MNAHQIHVVFYPYSFSTDDGGPVFFLDILASGVYVKDVLAGTYVASTTLANFLTRPLLHTMTVRRWTPSSAIAVSLIYHLMIGDLWPIWQHLIRHHGLTDRRSYPELLQERIRWKRGNLVSGD